MLFGRAASCHLWIAEEAHVKSRALVAGVFALLAITLGASAKPDSSAPAAAPNNTRELPSALSGETSVVGKDYRLHAVTAKDSAGHPLNDVPANTVDVYTGAGGWDSPKYSEVPAIVEAVPADMRAQIQLFYAAGSGWMLVPRGWILRRAAVGADGSSAFEFAPGNPGVAGWEAFDTAGACMGCMYADGDGIIPGAHARLEEIVDDGAPEPKLHPAPDSMTHPTQCMTVFRYHIKSELTAHAVVFLGHHEEESETDEEAMTQYLAMPDKDSKLAEFITSYFQNVNVACSGVD